MKAAVKNNKTARSRKAVSKTGGGDFNMKDLSKDPYVIKKKEQALEILRRTGIILNP